VNRAIFSLVVGIAAALAMQTSLWADEFLSERESLGKLKIGQKAAEVVEILGKPEAKGKDAMWEAIGEWVQEWKYPAQGVSLQMSAPKQNGTRSVLSLTARGACQFATARGIKIGSSEAEVRKAYGSVQDKEQSAAGKTFVAGSIYGGVIFQFKGGKVSEIFIGAAAE
jgi:hypothetical protein